MHRTRALFSRAIGFDARSQYLDQRAPERGTLAHQRPTSMQAGNCMTYIAASKPHGVLYLGMTSDRASIASA